MPRCALHDQASYTSWRRADSVAQQLPIPGRVYFCDAAGAYHIAGSTAADRARAVVTPDRPVSQPVLAKIAQLAGYYAQTPTQALAERLADKTGVLLVHIGHLVDVQAEADRRRTALRRTLLKLHRLVWVDLTERCATCHVAWPCETARVVEQLTTLMPHEWEDDAVPVDELGEPP